MANWQQCKFETGKSSCTSTGSWVSPAPFTLIIDNEVDLPASEEAADARLDNSNKETIEVTERVAVALDIELAAEEAVPEFPCDYCDFKGKNIRALNVHVGRIHKANGYSPIPQLD